MMRNHKKTNKKSWTRLKFRRKHSVPHRERTDVNSNFSWTPELFGPVFTNEDSSLRQALRTHLSDSRTRTMATFVPDELLYALDLTRKNFQEFSAVLLLIDMSPFHSLWERFSCAENNGSYGFSSILNFYLSHIVETIYSSEGDIINISAEGILALWKIRKEEFIAKSIDNVIGLALNLKDLLENFDIVSKSLIKVKMAVSSGLVIFSAIGNEQGRDFVMVGNSVAEIRKAVETASSGDLIVTESAWEHVSPENYEYVLQNACSVKIVRYTEYLSKAQRKRSKISSQSSENCSYTFQRISSTDLKIDDKELSTKANKKTNVQIFSPSIEDTEMGKKIFTGRLSISEATRRKLGTLLKTFTMKPVIQQIQNDFPLEHLTETRRVAIVVMNLVSICNSVYELLNLIDECYILINSIVSNYFGYLKALTIHDKVIEIIVVFGLDFETHDNSKNGLFSTAKSIKALKVIPGIKKISAGIATGMMYCGVVGHPARMNYVIFGSPLNTAKKIARISRNEISCEFDTVFYSQLPRTNFHSRGIKELKDFGRIHVYRFIDDKSIDTKFNNIANLHYLYPILGRLSELDIFTDILDDICASDRTYCGLLIEGPRRIGQSRLLDEFARIVESRQISLCKLCLDESNISKPYATIHYLLMQLLDAKDNKNMMERERILTKKLCRIVRPEDFCYMNILSRVSFPLSVNYYSKNEEEKMAKTFLIFDAILRMIKEPKCIIIDDAHFMDSDSCQFIVRLMNNNKFVLVMTMQPTMLPSHFPEPNNLIVNDARIFKHELQGIEPNHSSALICQILNVRAISRKIDNVFQSRKENHPGWCEAFVTLMLQNESLKIVTLSPEESLDKDLVFPDASLITKIPKDLSPEDTTPELSWIRGEKDTLVCSTSEKFNVNFDSIFDINEIHREIYNLLTPLELDLLQCAAILGNVFSRYALEKILQHFGTQETALALNRMVDIRILECASIQHRDFDVEGSTLCMYTNRTTFSDMHHIVYCTCVHSDVTSKQNVRQHLECKLFRFKSNGFRKFIDTQIARSKKNEYDLKVVEIYERDARKCCSCGGGRFFRTPGYENPSTVENSKVLRSSRRMMIEGLSKMKSNKGSLLKNDSEKSVETDVRRISIMPFHFDIDQESMSSLEAEKIVACVERVSGIDGEKEYAKFRKKTGSSIFITKNDPSRISRLRNFNHIDFRNCGCNFIIDCLFGKLYQHFENMEYSEKLIRFMIDYSSGLIQTGQSLHAMKILIATYEKIETSSIGVHYAEKGGEGAQIKQGIILALMGDASRNLGDNVKSKKYYTKAVRLCTHPSAAKKFCIPYRIFDQTWKLKFHQRYPHLFVNRTTGYRVLIKISSASYLARLSTILLEVGETAAAKLAALESFNNGFSCSGSFIEKSEIYLKIARLYRHLNNLSFARSLEKTMMYTIKSKHWWSDTEEVATVAIVFKSMFEIRLLRGEYEEALSMGIKVLKISSALKMTKLKLPILPQLIQLTIRTKRIHETVDLMKELYYSSPEDVDDSSITWYYALSLDLALDAGMILESFENCSKHAEGIIELKIGTIVSQDPESLRRLVTCLWLWQLRMNIIPTFAQSAESYTKNIRVNNFSHVLTAAKALECHLLTLKHCIDMKRADQLVPLLDDTERIVIVLEKMSKTALFVKPRFFMLKAYLQLIRGRKLTAMRYLSKASKFAVNQANPMTLAWIRQNEATWGRNRYNNMAHYWVEHVGFNNAGDWQNMHRFNIETWSSTLFPIPIPDTYL